MLFRIFHFFLSITVITVLILLISYDRKNIKIRFIIQLLIIEIIIAYFFINSKIGLNCAINFATLFSTLFKFAKEGTNFVFGNINNQEFSCFFLDVLCPIIFISALIGFLQYIRILPFFICTVGTFLSKINGISKLESFNVISSLILGQSENFIIYKNIIKEIPKRNICNMAITAMSTVSIPILGSYMNILLPKYVIMAIILNIFSTFIILSLLNSCKFDDKDLKIHYLCNIKNDQGFFEILGEYILSGFKIVTTITAMLIGFIALITTINGLFYWLFCITFQEILGYAFSPLAWIIGIPIQESLIVGKIMATKLISNEFVAMMDLKKIIDQLSPNSVGIISVFLVSFSNFSSIGIITGAIKELNNHQGNVVSRYGLKLVYSSTLVSVLSAIITSLVI